MFELTRITLIRVQRPKPDNVNDKLRWLGQSLGLFGLRDKDRSCFRIFIELLKSTRLRKPISSEQMADTLNLSRGTVIHHLNKLMEAGIVISMKNRYMLRVDNLEFLIDEVRKDVRRITDDLEMVAKEIDEYLKVG